MGAMRPAIASVTALLLTLTALPATVLAQTDARQQVDRAGAGVQHAAASTGVPLWVWIVVAVVIVLLLIAAVVRRRRSQAVIKTRLG